MAFVSESLASTVSSFVSEHEHARALITEKGERNTRWVDAQSNSVLYLLSKEDFAHGIASFEWLFFVDSVALSLRTSGHGGPSAASWQLQRVSSGQAIPEHQRIRLLHLIEDASRAYMEWYDRQFWEAEVWLDSNLSIDSKSTKWLDMNGMGDDNR
ncbi:hypothetical protein [Methylomonas sp. TEB]|uniref:hypothetical protein n=1 Tax=Methylomonas sp. TEB TaxID=3398229 RepID=UPI0039F514A1